MKPIAVVNYTDFNGRPLPEDYFALLRPYPTDFLLLQLSKINSLLFNNPTKELKPQLLILQQCFQNIGEEKRKRIVAFLMKHKGGKDVAFFTAPVVSRLIILCLQNYQPLPTEDEPVDITTVENNLFDCLLIQNQVYYSRKAPDDLNSYEAIWYLQLLQQDYIRSHSDLIFVAPAKNFLFYRFLTAHFPDGPKYIREFCKSVDIPAYFNYTVFFAEVLHKIIDSGQSGEAKHILTVIPDYKKLIDHFTFRPAHLPERKIEGSVHGELMTHPFYRISDDNLIIIDPHYFRYFLDIGLPFQFYKYSSLSKTKRFKKFDDFKGELGKKYYEEFVVKEILQNIFKPKNYEVLWAPDNLPLSDFTVVRNQRQVLMMEVKSAAIHFNPLEEVNIDAFKNFLNEQFCQAKSSEKEKAKGVYQLARQINEFATTNKLDEILKDPSQKGKATVWPVLIYTDDVMDMAGINAYLDEQLQRLVEAARPFLRNVQPLISVNLSFFIRYYAMLEKQPALLFKLMSAYVKIVKERNAMFVKKPFPHLFFDKNISFEQFVSDKLKENGFGSSFKELVSDLQLIVE